MLASIIYNHGKFCDDFKSTLKLGAYDELMEKSTYFVIYNDSHYEGQRENESSSLESLKKQMKKLAKIETEEELLWETEIYQNTFYREIHTIDVDVFERKYAKKIFAGMK